MSDPVRDQIEDQKVFPTAAQGWVTEATFVAPNTPQQSLPTQICKKTRSAEEYCDDTVGSKVFVGGVSWQASENDLIQFFSSYGQVTEAKIIRDASTGKSKGYGFVTFSDDSNAAAVKAIGFVELLGRKCQVGDAMRGVGRGGGPLHTPPSSPAHPSQGMMHRGKGGHSPMGSPGRAGGGPGSPQSGDRGAGGMGDRSVFVGGLPRQADENALVYFFSQWGAVAEVKVIYDNNNVSKGFGFVTFTEAQTASLVKSYGTVEFMGRQMNVGDAMRGASSSGRGRTPHSPHMLSPLLVPHHPTHTPPPPLPPIPHDHSPPMSIPTGPPGGYSHAGPHFAPPMPIQGSPYGMAYPGFPGYGPMEYGPSMGYGIPGYNVPAYGGYGYGAPGYAPGMGYGGVAPGFEGYIPQRYMPGVAMNPGMSVTPPAPVPSAQQPPHQPTSTLSESPPSLSSIVIEGPSIPHPIPHPPPHPTPQATSTSTSTPTPTSSSTAAATATASTPSGSVSATTVSIPAGVMGSMGEEWIGGQLEGLGQQSGARLLILASNHPPSHESERHIQITGTIQQIKAAEQLVNSIFVSAESSSAS